MYKFQTHREEKLNTIELIVWKIKVKNQKELEV
jgi:hypothetical protein